VNFLEVKDWILMSLATMGARGRSLFNQALAQLLDGADVSRSLKVAWNAPVSHLVGGGWSAAEKPLTSDTSTVRGTRGAAAGWPRRRPPGAASHRCRPAPSGTGEAAFAAQ
jgi:hypothetical protein